MADLIFASSRRVSTSVLLAALQAAAKTVPSPLTPAAYRRAARPGAPSIKVIYARFGSWQAAVREAGLP